MKKLFGIYGTLLLFAACTVSKNQAKTENSNNAVSKSDAGDGIYDPEIKELNAIKLTYPTVELANLKEGYILYAYGPCINCHKAKNIYQFDEVKWKSILDEMAVAANISDSQKDAVYKYILSIKATQNK